MAERFRKRKREGEREKEYVVKNPENEGKM